MFNKRTKIFLLILMIISTFFVCSCAEKEQNKDDKMSADKKAFMNIAPDEIKELKEFDLLYSDKYYFKVKITYLYNDSRMIISRDGDKYDIFTETASSYSHNIVKDNLNYKLLDEKKTYSVSELKEEVKISFFELNGNFVYKGVSVQKFNNESANLYKFDASDKNGKKSELIFAVKDKKMLGVITVTNGLETKLTIEDISEKLPENAFVIPKDYVKK